MTGWDDPEVAAYYEAFCTSHSRYQRANAALIAHADIAPGMRILDLAAGTGRTTESALRRMGNRGAVVCVESSANMRTHGMRRIQDPRVEWRAELPEERASFDRILCGAAIWQMVPLGPLFVTLAYLLKTGGALCFNIPALYLMEGDEPGGGGDPLLLELPGLLMEASSAPYDGKERCDERASLTRAHVIADLTAAGLDAVEWSFHTRMTQDAYATWLKIPATTNQLLGALSPAERARQIDLASTQVDRRSWKRERWRGWTAWKR